jgi:dipeptidase E
MNLLLTSDGLANKRLQDEFTAMVGHEVEEPKVAFIPTAANVVRQDKGWMLDNMHAFQEMGCHVDVIDIAAKVGAASVAKTLERFDAICVGGGNSFYLSHHLQESGLDTALPELLDQRVYVGISAGSVIAGRSLLLTSQAMQKPEHFAAGNYDALVGFAGQASGQTLNFADVIIRPHFDSRIIFRRNTSYLEEVATTNQYPVIAIDDQSALRVTDKSLTIISEGDNYWTSEPID